LVHSGNCSVAVELARYVEWFLTSSQAEAEVENHLMVPVSPSVVNRIHTTVLERMTCDGQLLIDLVRHQKYVEAESLKTWKLPVQIVSPLVAVIILLLAASAIAQRVQYLRMLNRDDWKISPSEIEFVVRQKRRRTLTNAFDTENDGPSSSNDCLGCWNNNDVVTRPLSIARVFDVNRRVKQTLMGMREKVIHENVARFFGILSHSDSIYLVEQYCANGTLVDFLRDNKFGVNQSFLFVVCADIANGMAYLHGQNLIHGNLSIDKCHVDSRWTIKIIDWEYTALYAVVRRTDRNQTQLETCDKSIIHFVCNEGSRAFRHLAPEIQKDGHLFEPTRAGDVYSFGMIIRDMFIDLLGQEQFPATVQIGDKMTAKARQIMELACHKTAIHRPTFEQLEKSMRSATSSRHTNLLERCVHQ